jgi:hypothetical protein
MAINLTFSEKFILLLLIFVPNLFCFRLECKIYFAKAFSFQIYFAAFASPPFYPLPTARVPLTISLGTNKKTFVM